MTIKSPLTLELKTRNFSDQKPMCNHLYEQQIEVCSNLIQAYKRELMISMLKNILSSTYSKASRRLFVAQET